MSGARSFWKTLPFLGASALLPTVAALAFQVRQEPSRFDPLVVHDPPATTGVGSLDIDSLSPADPFRAGWESFRITHGPGWRVVLDRRSGAPLLVEGQGIPWIAGGRLLADGSAEGLASLERSLRSFVAANEPLLLARETELTLRAEASGPLTPDVWQIAFDRKVSGIPVIGQRYLFTIGHGNLVSFGASQWSDVTESPEPTLAEDEALARLTDYMGLGPSAGYELVEAPGLAFLPVGTPGTLGAPYEGPVGAGYRSALVWTFSLRVPGEPGTWLGRVDAHSGRVLAFYDSNHYALAKGGVYPESPDGTCPSGCEQPAWPMPYADVTIDGTQQTASTMGLFDCSPAGSTATTRLAGPYARISDNCGIVQQTTTCNTDLDLGVSGGADCAVPAGSSAGNTHSSRTTFYHVNRIAEHARAWLPSNTWLTNQLTCNVNISSTCNAFWNGTINMYRSGGGCNNTGEIAGVINHEWGHGMDQNDGGGYDNPSEAYADISEFMYDHTSCIGRGFYQSGNCGGYGNACLNCSGIRDMDWDQRANHQPSTPGGFVANNCGGGSGPCGRAVHCEGYVGGETLWDLAVRDLPGMGLDPATAWQLTDKLWYKSRAGSGGNAWNCSLPNSDGCGSTSWFTKLRNIDDDDGNLNNGTPHAAAIFAAFNRHNIACGNAGDASNQNTSSCPSIGGTTLTARAGSSSNALSWTAVANAASYNVLRSDLGCDSSFTIIANVAAPVTDYTDANLADDFTNIYRVQAVGSNSACDGPVSNCVSVTPQPFAGTISLDRATYGCSVVVNITVRDANVGASTTTATVFSDTETSPETVVLTQTAPGSANYVGTISTTSAAPASDGLLSVTHGDLITARYVDADDGEGGSNLTRQTTAAADCVGPVISGVGSTGVTDALATIVWTTSEPANSVVRWGPSKPPGNTTSKSQRVTSHSVGLAGLQQCTVYYYQVESTDPSGNLAVDDNGGQYYHFETLGDFGQGLQPCHQGRVFLDRTLYSCSQSVGIELIDIDLNANPLVAETVAVQVTSTTETSPETVVLTETGPATSTFSGTILTDPGAPAADGRLQTSSGDVMTATYHDADDGTGSPAVAWATATADCAGPRITNLAVTDLPPGRVRITWTTDEPGTSRVDWGPSAALGKTVSAGALVTSHSLLITALDFCGGYFFRVSSTDAQGNTAVADRGGLNFTFQAGDVPGRVFFDNFETDKGWTLNGEWQRASPMGLGTAGGRDPSSAWSGALCLGTDLTGLGAFPGDYEPNQSIAATSPPIDARTLANGRLIFRRWLGVAQSPDQARIALQLGATVRPLVEISNVAESSWSLQSYDISRIADGQNGVQIVFSLTSDSSGQYGGWNIDDLIIKDGSQPDAKVCGGCTNKPSFAGLASAADADPCGDTGVTLSWQRAASWGSGGPGTYAVYRDTVPGFTPSAANRIASGLTGLGYTDAAAPNGATLYYLVRAENNETCSSGPNNNGVQDDNAVYLAVTDAVSQPAPGGLGASLRVTEVADTHVRLSWTAAAGASSYRVYRGNNPQMTGASVIGTTGALLFEDLGEATLPPSRYYVVRGVNACGVEGP